MVKLYYCHYYHCSVDTLLPCEMTRHHTALFMKSLLKYHYIFQQAFGGIKQMYRCRILIGDSLLQQENNPETTGNVNYYVDYN